MQDRRIITFSDLACGDDWLGVLGLLALHPEAAHTFVGTYGNRETHVATLNLLAMVPVAVGLLAHSRPAFEVWQGQAGPAINQPYQLAPDRIEYTIHGNFGYDRYPPGPYAPPALIRYPSVPASRIQLISLGATTDPDVAVRTLPRDVTIESCVVMAGSLLWPGNTGSTQEANARHNPAATAGLFEQSRDRNFPLVLVGLNCTEQTDVLFTPGLIAKLKSHLGSKAIWPHLVSVLSPDSTYGNFYSQQVKLSPFFPWPAHPYLGVPPHDLIAVLAADDFHQPQPDQLFHFREVPVQHDYLGNLGPAKPWMPDTHPATVVGPLRRPKAFIDKLVATFEKYT